jgi:hypothetical protein
MILVVGDYKAKLVKDDHETVYESIRVYELRFVDKKTRKFDVIDKPSDIAVTGVVARDSISAGDRKGSCHGTLRDNEVFGSR